MSCMEHVMPINQSFERPEQMFPDRPWDLEAQRAYCLKQYGV